jgi:hypothetical protein
MRRELTVAALALVLSLAGCAPRGSLVRDGAFERGIGAWRASAPMPAGVTAEWAPHRGRDGSGALHLVVPDTAAAARARWTCTLTRVLADSDVRFSAWVHIAPGSALPVLSARAIARNGRVQSLETTEGAATLSPESGWVLIGATLTTFPSTHRVELRLAMAGAGEAWIDDVAVEALPASEPR